VSKIDVDMAALRHLAWASTVPADGDYEAQTVSRTEWLAQASPEDWHRFALGFNWDDPIFPLVWIVCQEQCDMATALHIFWHSEPGWDLMKLARGEKVYEREEAPIIATIAKRVAAQGYQRRKIAWDPTPMMRRDFAEMKADIANIANPPWPLHPDLLRSVRGKEVMDSAEAWEKRPAGVRTGFWLDLPPCTIVTPNMITARDEMSTVLFNGLSIGAVLAAMVEYANDPQAYRIMLLFCAVMIGVWGYGIKRAGATIRSLMRSEGHQVPARQMGLMLAGIIGVGALWLHGYFALSALFVEAKAVTLEARAIKAGLCAACLAPVMVGRRWLAEQITYRWLFL
jgi:hypothetical protein